MGLRSGSESGGCNEYVLQGYDCYLERVALRTATCPPARADQELFFWNMHNASDVSMSNMDAAKEAVNSWINQIRHNGLGSANVFTEFEYWRASMPYYGLFVPIEDYVNVIIFALLTIAEGWH
ncbi:hypothetical protein ANCDUO_21789 [Ancylostoma duodenale]|uniref:SCP domain-containing protein n=1 Tax=Ancylostoma duodenale TaxID=51022 RepID=A0A0C2FN35_9BILA|nr:hypothetical protein ANCDUO_21789 [Ancylostoma duodenale]